MPSDLTPLLRQYQRNDSADSEKPAPSALPAEGQELVLAYQRALLAHTRTLSLAQLGGKRSCAPLLADVYVDRSLLAVDPQSHEPTAFPAPPHHPLGPTLLDLIREPRARVLLTGVPGSGKTTSLRWVAFACAGSLLGEAEQAGVLVAWPDQPPLPILLILAESNHTEAAPNLRPASAPLARFSIWPGQPEISPQESNVLARSLQAGGWLVLIDGLDGLDEPRSAQAIAAIHDLIASAPDNRYLVAWNEHPHAMPQPLPGFARYRYGRLEEHEADTLIAQWYAAIVQAGATGDLSDRISALQGHVRIDGRLRALMDSPLALVLCVLAHADGHALPAARGTVFRRLVELLLDPREEATTRSALGQMLDLEHDIAADEALSLLQPLALALQARTDPASEQPAALSGQQAAELLREPLARLGLHQHALIERMLLWCCRRGILVQLDRAAYAMPWRPVREYLAARALAQADDIAGRALELSADPRWHEVILLAVGELDQAAMPQRARLVIRKLLESAQQPAGQQGDDRRSTHAPSGPQRWESLLLGAESLIQLEAWSQVDRPARPEVSADLVALLGMRSCPLPVRIRAGLALGHLGDPRFGELLPPLAQVPGGTFVFGSSGYYNDEGPAQRVHVTSFAIGIYAVTNQEYARFLAAQPDHPRPHYWHDPRFNNPSQPVVGVAWNDANAYCQWLSGCLEQAGQLSSGMLVRLPSEVEWEKAASWNPRRQAKQRYPWGDDWSSARANTAEGRGAWVTAPVGCYPDGVSPYGVHDMVGNIWEWTASVYANYSRAAMPFREAGSYSIRGSSCVSLPKEARNTYRSRLPATFWRYHLGFRIVVARPLRMP